MTPSCYLKLKKMQLKYIIPFLLLCNQIQLQAQVPNDLCNNAITVQLGTTCQAGNNEAADTLPDQTSSCVNENVQDIWYDYTAGFTGILKLTSNAGVDDTLFNDVLSIYTGSCASLTEIHCSNQDEYGFQGEQTYLQVSSGQHYFFSLSGQAKNFGRTAGDFCLLLEQVSTQPDSPTNDICEDATVLTVNADWVAGHNHAATTGTDFPDDLTRTRADVWYQFTPTVGTAVSIEVQADFSHSIALYSGTCGNLFLVEKDLQGFKLNANNLPTNQSYFVQISGLFSSLEGDFSIKIKDENIPNPTENNICNDAILVETSQACTPFDIGDSATFSGIQPTCAFYAEADIWFKYVAPNQDAMGFKINTGADFPHSVAVWEDAEITACDSLEQVFCGKNVLACENYMEVKNIQAGATYYIQILTDATHFSGIQGSGCLEIIDILQNDNFLPLDLNVTAFCLSDALAELHIETSGGDGNYSFYGNSQNEQLVIGSTYFVQVIDGKGCTQTASGIVDCSAANDCDMFYYLQAQHVTCPTETDGTATISVSGDASPSFLWSNGQSTATVTDLGAGRYNVTVTNSESCSFEVSVTITAPAALTVHTRIKDSSEEGAADGRITLLPNGGTPPYSYQWVEGNQTTQTIENVMVGDYVYTVIDANNCAYTATAAVVLDEVCPENRNLSLVANPNTVQTLSAANLIISSSVIADQANMVYKAGNRIELKAGFRAFEGSDFRATIEDCSQVVLSLPDEEEVIELPEEVESETGTFTLRPNPFHEVSLLEFYLRRDQSVSIALYTPAGQLVQQVMKEQELEEGAHQVQLRAQNLPTGVYFVVMESLDIRMTQALVLIK